VLAAQANGLALVAVAAGIVVVAVHRIGTPVAVVGPGLLTVATAGLVVNVVSARTLHGSMGANLNVRAAFIHMVSDAAGSVAAIVAGIGVVVWNARGVDPVASIVIAVLVLWSAFRLLRDTAHVLLEGTPRGMDPTSVERALAADDAVEAVHHLHLWNLASDVPALSAHVVLRGEVTLHDAQEHGNRLKRVLIAEFGIEHTTLELECHPCDEPATFVPPT
jgi:cobalt-zinc-cadmium efflux system protein